MEIRPELEDILIKDINDIKLSPAETRILISWLDESPTNKKIYDQMKLVFLSPNPKDMQKLRSEIWSDVEVFRKQSDKPQKSNYFSWYRAAAIFIFLLSVSFLYYKFIGNGNDEIANLNEVKMVGKISERGQKLTTTLPDGSLVKLNGDSKILYAEDFIGDERAIILYGEAFFDVVRDESKPFIIKTKDFEVKVLGTSFNVKSYPGEASSKVAVESGEVAVTGSNQQVVALEPGERVYYTPGLEAMSKEKFVWEEEYGWKDNILLFNSASLPEIYEKLSRWYGVEFKIEDEMPDKKFSGRYENPTLKAVLEGLSYVYNFNYQIESEYVILNKQKKNEH